VPITRDYTFQQVHIISALPSSTAVPQQDEELEERLRIAHSDANSDWKVSYARMPGEGAQLAEAALAAGADLIAVRGDDRTISEVAVTLYLSAVPLLILPVEELPHIARRFGITGSLSDMLRQTCMGSGRIRWLDLGRVQERIFLHNLCLRDDRKNLSATDQLRQLLTFTIKLDGEEVNVTGSTLTIINLQTEDTCNIPTSYPIQEDDGWLDLIVQNLYEQNALVFHGRGKEITVTAKPQAMVFVDGEPFTERNIETEVIPKAVRLFMPI
jgi:diacylglycerol kinase family enzyme